MISPNKFQNFDDYTFNGCGNLIQFLFPSNSCPSNFNPHNLTGSSIFLSYVCTTYYKGLYNFSLVCRFSFTFVDDFEFLYPVYIQSITFSSIINKIVRFLFSFCVWCVHITILSIFSEILIIHFCLFKFNISDY
jgi:hypothetical protein